MIYDSHAADNEEQSAAWAEDILRTGHLAPAVSARVRDLILATQHRTVPDQPDAILLVDIDLASLGYAPEQFDRNNAAIRQEYAWVPEAAYREARTQVLGSFLARPGIYQTAWFRDRYEVQARENLARVIQGLRQAGS